LSDTVPADTQTKLKDYFKKAAGLGFSGAVLLAKDVKSLPAKATVGLM
jgi:hypothetical protein